MQPSATIQRLCFAHTGAFIVPAEALGHSGMDPDWAHFLVEEGHLTAGQLACLEAAHSLYWQRATALFTAAPGSWFPPRQTNLLLVRDAASVVPYFDPFGGTTSMLYVSDLDTHPEYVAFLLLHNERVGMLRSLRAALICNLSHWLVRDDNSRLAFAHAARAATRPDAAVFVLLADALPWIAALRHQPLHPPAQDDVQPYLHVAEADLFVPQRLQAHLTDLCNAAEAALRQAMPSPKVRHQVASAQSLSALCEWLVGARAHLIVKSPIGKTLWAPGATDPRALRGALRSATTEAVASLHADFQVVHERSRTFLDALADPSCLPRHSSVLVDGDGAYLSAAERAIVYELKQPGFDACAVAAPPIHRLLLGARVVHEWGHLAHAGKLLRVPAERKPEYTQARAELGECFHQVLARVPARLQGDVQQELASLAPLSGDRPAALARKTLARVGDYLANLLCSRLLPEPELQAYVRNNVRNHLAENLGVVSELARYAYEIHYLALADMPRSYFFGTSRYVEYFIDSGIISAADTHTLFDAAGRVLACYGFDEAKLRVPERAAAPALG